MTMLQIDKEYAEALFEISAEEGKVDLYLSELAEIKAIIAENPEYIDYLYWCSVYNISIHLLHLRS